MLVVDVQLIFNDNYSNINAGYPVPLDLLSTLYYALLSMHNNKL